MDWTIFARYAAPIIALVIGAFLNRRLERRPKLNAYLLHTSSVLMKNLENPIRVNMHTVVFSNAGREKATNVRLGHSYLPEFSLYPDVPYTIEALKEGHVDILLPTVIPGEQITVQLSVLPASDIRQGK